MLVSVKWLLLQASSACWCYIYVFYTAQRNASVTIFTIKPLQMDSLRCFRKSSISSYMINSTSFYLFPFRFFKFSFCWLPQSYLLSALPQPLSFCCNSGSTRMYLLPFKGMSSVFQLQWETHPILRSIHTGPSGFGMHTCGWQMQFSDLLACRFSLEE